MKKILRLIPLLIIVLLTFSCDNDDNVPSTVINTTEYFKYTLNSGQERVFDTYAKGHFTPNTNSAFEKFFFRAGAETSSGASFHVDGDFTFQDFSAFTASNNFSWGVSDGITSNFYFTEISSGYVFMSSVTVLPSTPIQCNVTVHPTNVGDYIEFTFTGNYLDALDNTIQGHVEGEGRILREMDQ